MSTTASEMSADMAPEPQNMRSPKKSSLIRSSVVMASGTLLSRILGFVRAAMLVAAIGSVGGGVMAAFQTANTLPNMVFNILAAGILDAVLVPQIVRALKRDDGAVFVNRLLTISGTILFLLTIIAMVAAPLLVMMTAASYSDEIRALSIAFSLICLPQIFFYGIYNLLGEVLNAQGIFGPYTWAPIVNNLVGILGLGIFLYMWGAHPTILPIADFTSAQFWVLAGSATLGVISQAAVLIIPLKRSGLKLRLDFNFRETSFGSIPRVVGWTFGILAVSQIGIFSTSNLVASADAWANANQGDVSALTDSSPLVVGNAAYATAFMVFMVPQSLIAISLATALFTRIANAAAVNDHREIAEQFHIGVRSISTLNLLAAAILIAGSIPMMQMVLPSASPIIVEAYAWVLVALLPGVASMGLSLMSQRLFFAYEDAKPAFMTGIIPNIVQVIVGWTLFFLVSPAWWVVGAAFAETVARVTQGFISLRMARKGNPFIDAKAMVTSFLRSSAAAVAACAAGMAVMALMGWHTSATSVTGRIFMAMVYLSLIALVAIPVYWAALRFLSPAETAEVGQMIVNRFPVPGPLRRFLVGGAGAVSAASTAPQDVSGTRIETLADRTAISTSEGTMSTDRFDNESVDLPTQANAFGAQPDGESVYGQPSGSFSDDASHAPWQAVCSDSDEHTHLPLSVMHEAAPGQDPLAPTQGAAAGVEGVGEPSSASGLPSFDEMVHGAPPSVLPPAASPSVSGAFAGAGSAAGSAFKRWVSNVKHGVDSAMAKMQANVDADADTMSTRASAGPDGSASEPTTLDEAPGVEFGAHAPLGEDSEVLTSLPVLSRSEEPAEEADVFSELPPADTLATTTLPSFDDATRAEAASPADSLYPGAESVTLSALTTEAPQQGGVSRRSYREAFDDVETAPDAIGTVVAASRTRNRNSLPAMVFFIVLTLIATVWAVRTASAPVDWDAPSFSIDSLQSTQSAAQSGDNAQSAAPEPVAAHTGPKISSVEVISWRNDQGDNENHAINMIDGNPETEWHSRQFDSAFGTDTGITIVVKLEKPAPLSAVNLKMHDQTSGGELFLQRNAADPRKGEILAQGSMSASTTLSPASPQEVDSFVLRFGSVPQAVDGLNWAWIYEIEVK